MIAMTFQMSYGQKENIKITKEAANRGGLWGPLESWHPTAACIKIDDRNDYHHHYYCDYYVSVSVRPCEYIHSSLPFSDALLGFFDL
jgi:hypothetical protein